MPGSAHGSDDTEVPILRDFVNGHIGEDPRRTPSPRSELLSPSSNRAGAVEIRLPRQASSRYRRTRELALRNVPAKELLGRLIDQEYQSRQFSKALRQSFERIQAEVSRADEAVRAFNDATQHIRTINEAKIIAIQEASRAKEDLRLYKFQLDNAQREILRAQDVVKMLEEQRDAAEIAAARARTTARRMNEERLIVNAREEGRRLGFEAGFRRAQEGLRNRDPDARRRYQADLDLMGIDYHPEERYLTRRDQPRDVDQLQDDDSDDPSSIHTYTPPRHSPNVIRLPDDIRLTDDNRLPSDIRDGDPIYIPEPITLPIAAPAPPAVPPRIERPPSVKTPAVEVFQLDIPSADNLSTLGIRPSSRRNAQHQDTRQPRAPSRQTQAQARSRSRSRDVPPDNYIPSSFEGNIPIPPPHQMSQPPPPLEDDDNYRSDARSRGPDAAGPSRPRDYPRRRSIDSGSASTHLSSLAIVSAPSSNAPATRPRDGGPRRAELSIIPEDLNSRQTSPVVSTSRRSWEGNRPVSSMSERPPAVPSKGGGSAYDDALSVGGGSNITTREHQRRWDSQRNREAMQRAADPYDRAAEDWTRHQTPEARPPRIRPAHLTTPAPLASSTPRLSVAHQRSRTMSANYQSSPQSSSQLRNSQDDINIRIEPPSQTPTDTLGHNSFAENQNQMLSPRASPAPSRHGTTLVPTVPNTPTMPSAPLQWPQDGQLPSNFVPDSTYRFSATQSTPYQQEQPPSRPHSRPSSSMGHTVPVPPAQNYAPSRPASVRSIASRHKSLNTPASANVGLPGDEPQSIRRVPSNASIASGGSYASFDPNTYLDPAYLTTPETRANTYANAGPTHSRSRSRANSNASQLSYLTYHTH